MTIERALHLIAGTIVLSSAMLAWFHDPRWIALTAFVGANLLQSAYTNWCPMVSLLAWLGLKPCAANQP